MLKQIEEMKELGIPSIVVSTKDDVLLLIREAKYFSSFPKTAEDFLDAKFHNMEHVIE